MTDSNRTESGDVSQSARDRYGMGGKGKFPVFDHTSAMAAISLRGHGDTGKEAVLDKVSRYATGAGDAQARAAVEAARKKDQGD